MVQQDFPVIKDQSQMTGAAFYLSSVNKRVEFEKYSQQYELSLSLGKIKLYKNAIFKL